MTETSGLCTGCDTRYANDLEGCGWEETATRAWASGLLGGVGLGVTRPRVLVLAALRGRPRPVTAQDLHRDIRAELRRAGAGEQVPGLTTVYRILAALTERGMLHCFHRDGGVTSAYRLCQPARHDHLICRCCGRVQEQPAPPVGERALPAPTDGFLIEDCHTEVIGLCAACRPGSPAR